MKNQQIRNAMEKYDITQKRLAEILNTSETVISHQLQRNLAQSEQKEIVKAIQNSMED